MELVSNLQVADGFWTVVKKTPEIVNAWKLFGSDREVDKSKISGFQQKSWSAYTKQQVTVNFTVITFT